MYKYFYYFLYIKKKGKKWHTQTCILYILLHYFAIFISISAYLSPTFINLSSLISFIVFPL